MAETAGIGPRAWLLPATAGVLLLIANGRNTVPLAAWLAPLFLLRFTRGGRAWARLPAAFSMLFFSWLFQFNRMVPVVEPVSSRSRQHTRWPCSCLICWTAH